MINSVVSKKKSYIPISIIMKLIILILILTCYAVQYYVLCSAKLYKHLLIIATTVIATS